MRHVHRISVASSPEVRAELAALGHAVAPAGLVSVEVDESDSHWPELERWVERRGAVDVAWTKFDEQGNELPGPIEPVGDWGLHSYRTFDDAISQALGFEPAPDEAEH